MVVQASTSGVQVNVLIFFSQWVQLGCKNFVLRPITAIFIVSFVALPYSKSKGHFRWQVFYPDLSGLFIYNDLLQIHPIPFICDELLVESCIVHHIWIENLLSEVVINDSLGVPLRKFYKSRHIETIIFWFIKHQFYSVSKKNKILYSITPSWGLLAFNKYIGWSVETADCTQINCKQNQYSLPHSLIIYEFNFFISRIK